MNTQDLAILAFFFGLFTTVVWIVIGWRAMLAHERIADASEDLARKFGQTDQR